MRGWLLLPFLTTTAVAETSLPDIIESFREAEVIILGEIHGNLAHNENQQLIIRSLFPSAIVFEMFTAEQAAVINTIRWDGDTLNGLGQVLEWDKSGWPPFPIYRALLEADAEGVVYGGAVPTSQAVEAQFEGAFTVYGPDGIDYGLDQPLSPEETSKREADFILSNCEALNEGDLGGLIELDRLRTAVMSDAILLALDEASYPVVVITSNQYARDDYGIPQMLRMVYPDILVKSLGQFEVEPLGEQPFSHVLTTGVVDREDPCLDFSE